MPRKPGQPKPAESELQILTAEINALLGGDIGSYSAEEAATLYRLFLKSKELDLTFKDRPSRRAHTTNVLEFWLKTLTMSCVALIAAVTVISVIWSTKNDAEQSKRVDKILQIIPGVLGGLGGGWALGKNWSKPKSEGSEEDNES